MNLQISYNPYTVTTDILKEGEPLDIKGSGLRYLDNKRLQEWMEPKGKWKGIFQELRETLRTRQMTIDFVGTRADFEDLQEACDLYGKDYEIRLNHKNRASEKKNSPYYKLQQLKKMYEELQNGPVEELKEESIRENFENAVDSEFRIVIVAPMSSGKSTLINAIVGRDLLPAVNQATTAVITEIKDNDNMSEFLLDVLDQDENVVSSREKATKERISQLNYEKDGEGKALYPLLRLEGPIPNLPSDTLQTVFVDTPGGNNANNTEHREMMNEAINDENKSLILYVFNGQTVSTDDGAHILKSIADAMKRSTNGKQSRDRFLFVANKMDDYDPEKEPYQQVIDHSILPMFKDYGIEEPKLYLTSAQTAKLVRMYQNNESMTRVEKRELSGLVDTFNDDAFVLTRYASLMDSDKEELIQKAKECTEKSEMEENDEKAERLRRMAADYNSGVPAVEFAIREYLEKYALAVKIKAVHDTFVKKVEEQKMVANCEKQWAESKEKFEAVKKEIQEKREMCDHHGKLKEFEKKLNAIKWDKHFLDKVQAEVTKEILDLGETAKEEIDYDEVAREMKELEEKLAPIERRAMEDISDALEGEIQNSCQSVVDEYADYIRELEKEGFFTIGEFDIQKTVAFEAFKLERAQDILSDDSDYVETRTIKRKKRGLGGMIRRFFRRSSGWEYEDQKVVKFSEYMKDELGQIVIDFEKETDKASKEAEKEVEERKKAALGRLRKLDLLVEGYWKDIEEKLADQKRLQKQVEKDKKKRDWLNDFVERINQLLAIE